MSHRLQLSAWSVAQALLHFTVNKRRKIEQACPFFVAYWDMNRSATTWGVEIVPVPIEYEVVLDCADGNVDPLPRRLDRDVPEDRALLTKDVRRTG